LDNASNAQQVLEANFGNTPNDVPTDETLQPAKPRSWLSRLTFGLLD
jgi:hypothetical protein